VTFILPALTGIMIPGLGCGLDPSMDLDWFGLDWVWWLWPAVFFLVSVQL